LQVVSELLPRAHGLREMRREFSKAHSDLSALAPKRKAAENNLKSIEKDIETYTAQVSDLESRIKQNKYDTSEHLRLTTVLLKAQYLDSVHKQFEQLEQKQKNNTAKIKKADAERRRLDTAARDADRARADAADDRERRQNVLTRLQEQ